MSLYFEERMNEQKEDAPNDKIVFTFPWILRRADLGRHFITKPTSYVSRFITTGYKFGAMEWGLQLTSNYFCVDSGRNHPSEFVASNSICNVSYTLFSDDAMRFELYSSPTVTAPFTHIQETDANYSALKTPNEFMTKLKDAFQKEQFAKIVIFVELQIPSKYFLPPFGRKKCCIEYPANFENDFKFGFLKYIDYSIKCPDDSVPALKIVLNQSSKFMEKHFMESKESELTVEHGIDVVKPIIYFLHSSYFQMPKSYNLDYVDRLMEALGFFEPVHERSAILSIQESLCQNFAKEPLNFDSILRWIKTSIRYKFDDLFDMIFATIINKYYYKWIETFPTNARNNENMLFREIFNDSHGRYDQNFEFIDYAFINSLFTNVILQ
uniref:MATH domain-containing protein n=1 Tax=Panagrolaimus davidi TaxID=227884 RepID=A0A914RDU5_9BILA